MAVHHMIWIKFDDQLTDARKQTHIDNVRSLEAKVPVVQSVHAGRNQTDRAPAGYTHGAVITVADWAALQAYDDHPEHQAIAKPLDAEAHVLAMDIDDQV